MTREPRETRVTREQQARQEWQAHRARKETQGYQERQAQPVLRDLLALLVRRVTPAQLELRAQQVPWVHKVPRA